MTGYEAALTWAAAAWGRPLAASRPLKGGWTSDMLLLSAESGDKAVLRLMVRDPWRRHALALLSRESDVQEQLSGGRVPAPRSIAVDVDGSGAGAPAHLMSWLPGQLELGRTDDDFLARLAKLLAEIHRHDVGGPRPREYESWAHAAKRVVPGWTQRPELWQRAFAVLTDEPPPYRGVFLHRDFHLGNVLWEGGEPSGVVDWVETSWGPAALDVAHCTTYLAMLHGLDVALRFERAYGDVGDVGDHSRYWSVMDIVGYLPGPEKVIRPWAELGHHVEEAEAQRRLEQLLEVALAR